MQNLNLRMPFKKNSSHCLICLLVTIASLFFGNNSYSQKWEELRNCQLVESESNDGDSFKVRHKGKEFIVRLYLVDTPETNLLHPNRNVEQVKEFGSTMEKTIASGLLAKELAQKLLERPFTVITKGEDAKGSSKMGRQYGIVYTSNRNDLGQVLLEHGLARSHGQTPNSSNPTNSYSRKYDQLQKKYDQIAQRAKRKNIGAWGKEDIKLPERPKQNTNLPNKINKRDIDKSIQKAQEVINTKRANLDQKNSVFSIALNGNRPIMCTYSFGRVGRKEENGEKSHEGIKKTDIENSTYTIPTKSLEILKSRIKNNTKVAKAIRTLNLEGSDVDFVISISDNKIQSPSFLGVNEIAKIKIISSPKTKGGKPLNKEQKEFISAAILEVFQEMNYRFFKAENLKISSRLCLQEAELWEQIKTMDSQICESLPTKMQTASNSKRIDEIIGNLKTKSRQFLEESKSEKKAFSELSGLETATPTTLKDSIGKLAQKSVHSSPSVYELLKANNMMWSERDKAFIEKERLKLNRNIQRARYMGVKTTQAHEDLRTYRNKQNDNDFSNVVLLLKNIDLLKNQRLEFEAIALAANQLAKLKAPVKFRD